MGRSVKVGTVQTHGDMCLRDIRFIPDNSLSAGYGVRVYPDLGYYDDKLFQVLPFVVKELTVVWGTLYGHHSGGRAFDSAAALLAHNPHVAQTLITHRMPLAAVGAAFDLAAGFAPNHASFFTAAWVGGYPAMAKKDHSQRKRPT